MRCDKCKYWDSKTTKWAIGDIKLGECLRAKPFWDRTEYKEIGNEWGRVLLPNAADDLMFVQDMSDCSAHLITKPEFYCANFKPL